MYKRGTAAHTQVDWLKRSFVLLTTRNTQHVVTQRGKPHTLRPCVWCVHNIHSSELVVPYTHRHQRTHTKWMNVDFLFLFFYTVFYSTGEVKRAKKCKTVLFTRVGGGVNVTWTVKTDLMELFHRADDKTPTYIIIYDDDDGARAKENPSKYSFAMEKNPANRTLYIYILFDNRTVA